MNINPTLAYIGIFAYLCGSIPSAFIIGKAMAKIDIRQHGSGNVGSTNALRTLGLKGGLISLLGDIFKTITAFALPYFIKAPMLGFFVAGLSVVLGHNWSIFLRFKGGKGVAVSTSVITLLYPWIGIASLVLLVLVVWRTKFVSLGSILMALFWPLGLILFRFHAQDIGFAAVLTIMIWLQHRSNIQRLIQGEERKINFTKK